MKMKDFISSNEVLLIIIGIFLLFPLFSNAQALVPDAQSSQMTRLIQDAVSNPAAANYQVLLNTKKLNEFYSFVKIDKDTKQRMNEPYQPVWIDMNSLQPNAKGVALRKLLQEAPAHGLWDVYWAHVWDPIFEGSNVSVQELAELDVKMSEAYLRYAHHIYKGRFNPKEFDPNIEMAQVEMKDFMLRLKLVARGPAKLLIEETEKLHPVIPEYRHLKLALANLRGLANKSWKVIKPAGKELSKGIQDAAVADVKERLSQLGYRISNQSPVFDDELDKNLRAFQLNSGLKVDGKIGANFSKVLNHLNVPLEQRIKQIELNMERYRWIPRKMDTRYIFVNVAMTKFNLRDDSLWSEKEKKWAPEAVKLQFRTINGRDVRKTPLMIRRISRVEFNPTWTVPSSIAIKDKLPILQKDPTYLDKHKMYLLQAEYKNGKIVNYVPAQNPDWTKITEVDLQSARYIIVQKQGYDNALGVVKFPLDGNSFSIYLHDTNERDLFNDENRHASSGCVRLQRPLDLAAYLLKDKPGYSMDEILKIVPSQTESESRATKVVSLAKPITVYLHYLTVFAKSNGEVGFADDDYGQDPILLDALNSPANNSSF
ncbi:murein L,D-transpeptidase [Bdellovibrio sp. ZAP7]|uniref:L,D-transpeptidase family protein n=1 Tax=Bdellovibrio sp. ZAP7 TaxID=2231053 RepID=UPI00143CCBAF|nr:L,D-transpeptidase family protein [Bdellovibrio sp. ZAP7]